MNKPRAKQVLTPRRAGLGYVLVWVVFDRESRLMRHDVSLRRAYRDYMDAIRERGAMAEVAAATAHLNCVQDQIQRDQRSKS